VLVVSLAGCPSLSCRGTVAAVVFNVGSVAGGSVRCRRPRRRMKAAVAARAPAAPVRSAASRFFPAPRESSRLRPDVTSPKLLPTLAGNPGLRFVRERCLLAPPASATRRLDGMRPACRRLDGRRAVSLVGMRSPLRSVGVWCRSVRAVARGCPQVFGCVRCEVLAGRANSADSQPPATGAARDRAAFVHPVTARQPRLLELARSLVVS
jgi:hypothetical protein